MASEIISREDAIARGLKRYFSGVACKHGHLSERFTCSCKCLACQVLQAVDQRKRFAVRHRERLRKQKADAYRRRKDRNPERVREISRAAAARYRAKDPEGERGRQRLWRLRNPGKNKAKRQRYLLRHPGIERIRSAQWRENNPEKAAEKRKSLIAFWEAYRRWRIECPLEWREHAKRQSAKWRRNNPEKRKEIVRRWARNNPEKVLATLRRRRARLRGSNGSHTQEDLDEILRLQRHRCAHCRSRFNKQLPPTLDHIVALLNGGANDRRNLQFLCRSCNSAKQARDPIDFAQASGRLL